MSAKAGSFNISTQAATNTVAVTGVGFTPTVLILDWSGRTEATDANGSAHIQKGFGVAVGATDRWSFSTFIEDGASTTDADVRQLPTACVCEVLTDGTAGGAADLQSFDADGFTLVIDAQFTTDFRVSYLALGGDHEGAVGDFDPTGTGSLSETGLGFGPGAVIFCATQAGDNTAQILSRAGLSFGVATGAANEWVTSFGSANAQNESNTNRAKRYGFGAECVGVLLSSAALAGVLQRVEFTSLDADGFTVNVLENTGYAVFWLAIGGGQYHASDFLTRNDTTQEGVTGTGFTPEALMVSSVMTAEQAQDTSAAEAAISVGFADSPTSRVCQAITEEEDAAGGTTECWTAIEHDAIYARGDFADATAGLMDLVSLDSDGFTFIMDDADPDAAFIGYLAVGAAAGGGTTVNPGKATLVYQGQAPTITETVSVPKATLVYTGKAPTVSESVSIGAASIVYTGRTPTVDDSDTLTPAAGSLVYQGQQPKVTTGANVEVSVPAGALVYTGKAPTVEFTITPDAATLTYTGYAPTVEEAVSVSAGSLVYQGRQPTVTAGSGVTVSVPAGSLTYQGRTPTIEETVSVPAGSLVYQGKQPTVTEAAGTTVSVPAGSLVYSGNAPTIAESLSIDAGSLVYTGRVPTIAETVTVPRATLRFNGFAPTADDSDTLKVGAASLRLRTFAPTVDDSETVKVGAGSLVYAGNAPSVLGDTILLELPYTADWKLPERKAEWET